MDMPFSASVYSDVYYITFDLDLYLQGHLALALKNHVCSVASTVLDGFFPYLVQMITSMRRCVAFDYLWPWPISSRSFDLDFENRVRSVRFSVLDRLFSYLPQIITTIRGCVMCQIYNKILKFQFFTKWFLCGKSICVAGISGKFSLLASIFNWKWLPSLLCPRLYLSTSCTPRPFPVHFL